MNYYIQRIVLLNSMLRTHPHWEKSNYKKEKIYEQTCLLFAAVRVREVLVNILGNAVKFTNDGGTVTYAVSYRPGIDDRHINVRYRIDDTGIGMSEDNELNAEIAIVQLEELGMKITRAGDGVEVVNIFADNPPGTFDIILMDVMMPNKNGYEATNIIRNLQNRPDGEVIPIIAMTANAFAEDVQASLDAGMNGHLSKPIVIDEVVKTIARNVNC